MIIVFQWPLYSFTLLLCINSTRILRHTYVCSRKRWFTFLNFLFNVSLNDIVTDDALLF